MELFNIQLLCRFFTLLFFLTVIIFQPEISAQESGSNTNKQGKESVKITPVKIAPVKITSDKLVAQSLSNYLEFSGNVRVTQGDTSITSKRLKVFYENTKEGNWGQDSIKKIIAFENVKIKHQDKTAQTQQAEYITKKQLIILTGENTKIYSGKNIITGAKITINLKNNNISIERGKENQVEAVFYNIE